MKKLGEMLNNDFKVRLAVVLVCIVIGTLIVVG